MPLRLNAGEMAGKGGECGKLGRACAASTGDGSSRVWQGGKGGQVFHFLLSTKIWSL